MVLRCFGRNCILPHALLHVAQILFARNLTPDFGCKLDSFFGIYNSKYNLVFGFTTFGQLLLHLSNAFEKKKFYNKINEICRWFIKNWICCAIICSKSQCRKHMDCDVRFWKPRKKETYELNWYVHPPHPKPAARYVLSPPTQGPCPLRLRPSSGRPPGGARSTRAEIAQILCCASQWDPLVRQFCAWETLFHHWVGFPTRSAKLELSQYRGEKHGSAPTRTCSPATYSPERAVRHLTNCHYVANHKDNLISFTTNTPMSTWWLRGQCSWSTRKELDPTSKMNVKDWRTLPKLASIMTERTEVNRNLAHRSAGSLS